MNDKEELLACIRERMNGKEGNTSTRFFKVMKEDPYLLKDLFQTFSRNVIVDAMLDETQINEEKIGVWVRRRGQSLPIYTEVYTTEEKQADESPYN